MWGEKIKQLREISEDEIIIKTGAPGDKDWEIKDDSKGDCQ